ncbi:hypothetical protein BKK52_03980 [Rodentibacter trehalosifermentans]|uniref:Uncharacterized protein n=1 Tax=Rodentibacter trehalosifermentans TaxID=1908263 RepID=A0A1V3J3G2_9PAST|nr:hypothetical protein BKK52_03980 [Rodentibacter trehalosifermentans]
MEFYFKFETLITFEKKYFKNEFKMKYCFYIMLTNDKKSETLAISTKVIHSNKNEESLYV